MTNLVLTELLIEPAVWVEVHGVAAGEVPGGGDQETAPSQPCKVLFHNNKSKPLSQVQNHLE
jgi:hypothetical protein